jgi:hypothetical protein
MLTSPTSPRSTALVPPLQRRPRRLSATVPWQVAEELQRIADIEGRSMSNFVAYVLERGLEVVAARRT